MFTLHDAAARMLANANRFMAAYHKALQPLCVRLDMPLQAADILLFLANNPELNTAGDICRCRGLKPGIVSFHVEKLVEQGYLERRAVPGDRRKCRLLYTEKAVPALEQGRQLQQRFAQQLHAGLSPEDLSHMQRCLQVFDGNLDRIRKEGL